MAARRALLVGINEYDAAPQLQCCVSDVDAMARQLRRNEDKSINFTCEELTSAKEYVSCALLRQRLKSLFLDHEGDALFYFSGHGAATDIGGYLLTSECTQPESGFPMRDLIDYANSLARKGHTALIILDCCYAGAAFSDEQVVGTLDNEARLSEGVTILAAARPRQHAVEVAGHGIFTRLVVAALDGGAADVRGRVSAAAIYAYAEAVLGVLDQRPIYKSHAATLDAVRTCLADVSDDDLRQLPILFPHIDSTFRLDPTFEKTEEAAVAKNVAIFQTLKCLQVARLVRCAAGRDLYFVALESSTVSLTPTGKLYWELAKSEQI